MGRNKFYQKKKKDKSFYKYIADIFAALLPGFVKTESHIKGTSTNSMKANLLFSIKQFLDYFIT